MPAVRASWSAGTRPLGRLPDADPSTWNSRSLSLPLGTTKRVYAHHVAGKIKAFPKPVKADFFANRNPQPRARQRYQPSRKR